MLLSERMRNERMRKLTDVQWRLYHEKCRAWKTGSLSTLDVSIFFSASGSNDAARRPASSDRKPAGKDLHMLATRPSLDDRIVNTSLFKRVSNERASM